MATPNLPDCVAATRSLMEQLFISKRRLFNSLSSNRGAFADNLASFVSFTAVMGLNRDLRPMIPIFGFSGWVITVFINLPLLSTLVPFWEKSPCSSAPSLEKPSKLAGSISIENGAQFLYVLNSNATSPGRILKRPFFINDPKGLFTLVGSDVELNILL